MFQCDNTDKDIFALFGCKRSSLYNIVMFSVLQCFPFALPLYRVLLCQNRVCIRLERGGS